MERSSTHCSLCHKSQDSFSSGIHNFRALCLLSDPSQYIGKYSLYRWASELCFKSPQIANPQFLGLIPLMQIRKFLWCASL